MISKHLKATQLSFAMAMAALPASALTLGPDFVSDYSATSLGSVPGLPTSYGGLTFLGTDPNTLLIGGAANTAGGQLYTVGVVRDATTSQITGFENNLSPFGDVGEYNDGGVVFGPDGVLFTAQWPVNNLGQTAVGGLDENRVDDLSPFGVGSSISALNFVPNGFAGAGQGKIVTYSAGQWFDLQISPDGTGTFGIDSIVRIDLDPATAAIDNLPGGPEGFVYIDSANPGFTVDGMLVSAFANNTVHAYDIDGNGNPILSSQRVFLSGLTGAEGAVIDPLTGDFLFSTFGGGNQVVRVDGFVATTPVTPPVTPPPVTPPPSVIPLPATGLLLLGSLLGLGVLRRQR